MLLGHHPSREWLETDGLGGFAMGGIDLVPTRRYHSLLTIATNSPAVRTTLVNTLVAWVEINDREYQLSSFLFTPGVHHPERCVPTSFLEDTLWPTWRFELAPDTYLTYEITLTKGLPLVSLTWCLNSPRSIEARLFVRPLISSRNYHALQRFDPHSRLVIQGVPDGVVWSCDPSHTTVFAQSSGSFKHEPQWYYGFMYQHEHARGYDYIEDLNSPGVFCFPLDNHRNRAALIITDDAIGAPTLHGRSALANATRISESERARRIRFESPLHRAADHYLVQRGSHQTIIAGYPWFADWGRDTFIAIRGLCVTSQRLGDALDIIECWIDHLNHGMLPNRFLDTNSPGGVKDNSLKDNVLKDSAVEYNAVDSALWFAIAGHEILDACEIHHVEIPERLRRRFAEAITEIFTYYRNGTRYRIGLDSDGLLAAGEVGLQLTWMDAKIGSEVVTPRIGKPVEIQALWINLLYIICKRVPQLRSVATPLLERAVKSFHERFWNGSTCSLYDVVDVGHISGVCDAKIRPNQILAVGGLPFEFLEGARARAVVDTVELHLLTPLGLRTLAPHEADYCGRYRGNQGARDRAYHQGSVWPWLMGPFIDAWIRVRGSTEQAKSDARSKFLKPLIDLAMTQGFGHLPELADGDYPHLPCGSPFQAWSLSEILRLDQVLGSNAWTRRKDHATTILS